MTKARAKTSDNRVQQKSASDNGGTKRQNTGNVLAWLLWSGSYLLMCDWAVQAFHEAVQNNFEIQSATFLAARSTLVALAAGASLWAAAGRRLPAFAMSAYWLLALAVHAVWLSVQVEAPLLQVALAGAFFLASSATYRGSLQAYAFLLAPLGVAALFAPLFQWEYWHLVESEVLRQDAGILFSSFAFAAAFAFARNIYTQQVTLGRDMRASLAANRKVLADLRTVESRCKGFLGLGGGSASDYGVALRTEEIRFALEEQSSSDSLTHAELHAVIKESLDEISLQAHQPRIRFLLTSPSDLNLPIAIRGNSQTMRALLRGLLQQAMVNIGAGHGVIRVAMTPGQAAISISIEDNGRGLSVDLLDKLDAKGMLDAKGLNLGIQQMRDMVARSGWSLGFQSRLGVGSRSTVSLPRIDAPQVPGPRFANRLVPPELSATN